MDILKKMLWGICVSFVSLCLGCSSMNKTPVGSSKQLDTQTQFNKKLGEIHDPYSSKAVLNTFVDYIDSKITIIDNYSISISSLRTTSQKKTNQNVLRGLINTDAISKTEASIRTGATGIKIQSGQNQRITSQRLAEIFNGGPLGKYGKISIGTIDRTRDDVRSVLTNMVYDSSIKTMSPIEAGVVTWVLLSDEDRASQKEDSNIYIGKNQLNTISELAKSNSLSDMILKVFALSVETKLEAFIDS